MKLDWNLISMSLGESAHKLRHHVILESVASTNDWSSWADKNKTLPAVCLAEQQTAGRGRCSRIWLSPASENLYLSLVWSFACGSAALSGLSLAAGVVIAQLIEPYYADVQIKWPNDIWLQGKKLGGVLIEARHANDGDIIVVIGVGINYRLDETVRAALDNAACDLVSNCDDTVLPGRNQLAGLLIRSLVNCCELYERQGFLAFKQEWKRFDMCLGHEIEVRDASGIWSGVAKDLDEQCGLVISRQNVDVVVYAADVSVRANYVND